MTNNKEFLVEYIMNGNKYTHQFKGKNKQEIIKSIENKEGKILSITQLKNKYEYVNTIVGKRNI